MFESNENLLDPHSEKHLKMVGDIIELWEDIEKVHPVLSSLVSGRSVKNGFRSDLVQLQGRMWHMREHLKTLDKRIDEFILETGIDEDE
ncbi:hypothetical protein DSM3645_02046 [Blastopirellula marina DSM 3645]|uniref:Uncharacterized protein n=1 Tax=Blastopirellula marina DSM 3645 TaxID=314230 RepID=A4A0P4_9BACT|nr:hypothetical protein DSM3645_02046 [Blastopirellula marina DSM 3645]